LRNRAIRRLSTSSGRHDRYSNSMLARRRYER